MIITKKLLERLIKEETSRALKRRLTKTVNLHEGLLEDLEKATGETLNPGRNVLWGYPVDIKDGNPEEGIDMRAVDRDASVALMKQLRNFGFKTRFDKKTNMISLDNAQGEMSESFDDYPPEMETGDPGGNEPCPSCGGTNTRHEDPIPGMMGGEEVALTCDDCGETFPEDPLHGGYGRGSKARR